MPLAVRLSLLIQEGPSPGAFFVSEKILHGTTTAILVDGGFFLRRSRRIYGEQPPRELANILHQCCLKHLCNRNGDRVAYLYRIFFYDCPPLTKKAHHPVTSKPIDFSKTSVAAWRFQFHEELKRLRKVALRLGALDEANARWVLRERMLLSLCRGEIAASGLSENDVEYEVKQKGVDMRIGLDIASLSYRKLVSQIVLISGDSDFVPAAKLARREGIDFVLDPMWADIKSDLFEHIDGLRSTCPRPAGARSPSGKAHHGTTEMDTSDI